MQSSPRQSEARQIKVIKTASIAAGRPTATLNGRVCVCAWFLCLFMALTLSDLVQAKRYKQLVNDLVAGLEFNAFYTGIDNLGYILQLPASHLQSLRFVHWLLAKTEANTKIRKERKKKPVEVRRFCTTEGKTPRDVLCGIHTRVSEQARRRQQRWRWR